MRPAWVEVDVTAIRDNVRAIKDFVGAGTGVLAVVKADGYGHGLIPDRARGVGRGRDDAGGGHSGRGGRLARGRYQRAGADYGVQPSGSGARPLSHSAPRRW